MDKIEFHRRKAENNIRSIKLMHKGNCVKTIEFSKYQMFRILLDIGKMLDRGDSKETIADYVLPYINLHSAEEELSLDDLIVDNAEYVEKYKKLLEQAEKSNTRQANTIKKLTEKNKELEAESSEIEILISENKKSLDLLKEKDGAITRQLKTISELEKEIEKLKSQKSELDIQVKEKEKIIKDLKSKKAPKAPAKKGARGRGKTKKTAEDIDIDGILEEGLN
ncbi:hypothetical protein [Sebaldella sp. S0638]|uniref:hypothetical protein n=1 Tax=Sebaldella sp. S0638 TaxID=2957809 RepID=UPI0020A12BB2|nr:hypothetical protein [Sebaldella sp. S0638]MCP1226515.1 hypothetical protein [Sebaldella sp. S0638]